MLQFGAEFKLNFGVEDTGVFRNLLEDFHIGLQLILNLFGLLNEINLDLLLNAYDSILNFLPTDLILLFQINRHPSKQFFHQENKPLILHFLDFNLLQSFDQVLIGSGFELDLIDYF